MNDGIEKGLLTILLLLMAAVIGGVIVHARMSKEMDRQVALFNKLTEKSNDAKAAAELRATNTEQSQAGAIADALATYKEKRDADKARDTAVITDLRNSVTRLRVRTNRAACGGEVPGAAAGGPGTAATGDETLAGPVAARLAERYADYNRLVDKLTACQAVVKADRLTTVD